MKSFICPTLAIDDITLPDTVLTKVVGGSSTYAALASSLFAPTVLGSIVGNDFPEKYLTFLAKRGVDTRGVQHSKKPSFHWVAKYSDDLHDVKTIKNELNAFEDFRVPPLKKYTKGCYSAFISNIDPDIQLKILKLLPKKTITIIDSMDLWMIEKLPALKKAIKLADIFMVSEPEAEVLVQEKLPLPSLIERLMLLGPKVVIYKRGEHGIAMYGKMGTLIVPSYPLTFAVDPSGAGDALGGAIAGVLSRLGRFDRQSMASAMVLGSIIASFTVEGYGTEGLEQVILPEVINRAKVFLSQLPCEDHLNLIKP